MSDTPTPKSWPTCPEHGYLRESWRDTANLCKQIAVDQAEDRRIGAQRHNETTGELSWIKARIAGLATGSEVAGLRIEVAGLTGAIRGREEGAAEITGEIRTGVRRGVVVAKWILGALAALLAGGGAVEGMKKLLGG